MPQVPAFYSSMTFRPAGFGMLCQDFLQEQQCKESYQGLSFWLSPFH